MSALDTAVSEEISYHKDPYSFETTLLEIGIYEDIAAQFRNVRFPFLLKEHQRDGIHSGIAWERYGLFDEARTGKTAIMHGLTIFCAAFDMKTIALMPPSLFRQFEDEFHRIEGHGLRSERFDYSPKKRNQLIDLWRQDNNSAPHLLIMTKDIFVKHSEALRPLGYFTIMYDEAHMGLGSETNKIYKALKKYIDTFDECKRLILSTGTPMPNDPYRNYPIISLKSPAFYRSRDYFDAMHVRVESGYQSMTYMHEAMMNRATRALKANVLDLKAPNIQKVPVELSKAHMAAYRSLIKNRYLEVNGTFIDARNVQALRQTALQAACDPDFISEKGSIKENAVVSTVRALLESVGAYDQRKVVLFANYTNTVEMLARVFKNDYNPAVVYGPNGPKKNQDEVYRFQNDGTCRIGIFNPIAGGVGIKAGHVSDVAIFVEPVSTPGQFDQAISRVMLEGQKEPVIAYILKILGTIWPTLIDLMEGKLSDLDEVLRDEKSVFDAFTGRA